ncbi:MAG: aminotransferase class V-fold PLP-dependent enzyme [Alphaproteobacteria bacterium]|nr:aminotransferase class V-fold PLP-dependent enzyme [Alphaproteobacteria bacterium]MCB9794676.1 aminotransferase class V-fold PLP-dependent enzyme [Alphaproteobacteria bacterium]
MSIDLARARAETPGCAHVVHLNNAGAALPPACVTEAVVDHLHLEAAIGGYEAAHQQRHRLAQAYALAGRLLGGQADEIAFTDSATRAFDLALWASPLRAGDRVLLSRVAYASNALALLELRRRVGIELVVLPSTPVGRVDLDALEAELRAGAALCTLTHVPTNSGLVQPAAEVGALCRAAGVPYLLDACQSAGQLSLDVGRLGCDMLSLTSRKYLRGPRGQGLLWVSSEHLPRLTAPSPDIGSARWLAPDRWEPIPGARRLECWEHSVASRLGFAAAMEYAMSWGLDAIEARVTQLAASLRAQLDQLPGVQVCDPGEELCGIVTFTVEGWSAQQVAAELAEAGVNVSVSQRPSTLLDMTDRDLEAVVRASVHYYNSEAELVLLVEELRRLR